MRNNKISKIFTCGIEQEDSTLGDWKYIRATSKTIAAKKYKRYYGRAPTYIGLRGIHETRIGYKDL